MQVSGRLLGPRTILSAVLLLATVSFAFQTKFVSAAQITQRSLTLETGATGDGGSKAGGNVNHQFTFTVPTGGNIGSIQFLYCTTASNPTITPDPCTTPTGLVTTSATLGNDTGSAATGFSMVTNTGNTPNGTYHLTRTAASVNANDVLSFQIDGITNPTAENEAFFVRISTFASTDTTGTATDTGTVAASTATQIELSGTMPESLIFCTGDTIGVNGGGIPDCSTAGPGDITFDQLFSPTDTATASSQMAASTNAMSGYNITVAGTTLESGANEIPAMSAATTGSRGSGQFGMNLTLNTTTTSTNPVGALIAPLSNGTNLRAQAAADYAIPDTFKFVPGESIARSDNGSPVNGAPTDTQIYTVSYIVNVAGSQPAGTYVSTLTYVCTATF